jgi:hypothetical protein
MTQNSLNQANNAAYNAQRKERQARSNANAHARSHREAIGIINEQNRTIDRLNARVEKAVFNADYFSSFAVESLNTVKELAARSAEPGNEALRELAFQLYVIDLCGAPYEYGIRGAKDHTWLDTLRNGLFPNGRRLGKLDRREINLKLMVRAEFYTFAKITKKLNAFQTKVLEALTMQSNEYPRLRDPRLVDVVVREVKAHNDWIAKLEAAPQGDISLQTQWEKNRLAWWNEHVAYLHPDHTVPLFEAMLKKNPNIRVDDFHAAGRIARDAGWHINSMKPTKYYTDDTVACYRDSPKSFCPQEMML